MQPTRRDTTGSRPELLSDEEGRTLLRLGARALHNHYRGAAAPRLEEVAGAERSPRLEQRRGAFVTLTREGALRGCLGSVVGTEPLWRSIVRLAVAAATQDPRFAPVTADELERLSEEISVLTPPRPIAPEEIEVGRHGLIVQRGPYSGLLLPQVATEHGLDREQFLEHTCLKAGLDRGAWRRAGTGILGFEAQVFGPERLVELL